MNPSRVTIEIAEKNSEEKIVTSEELIEDIEKSTDCKACCCYTTYQIFKCLGIAGDKADKENKGNCCFLTIIFVYVIIPLFFTMGYLLYLYNN